MRPPLLPLALALLLPPMAGAQRVWWDNAVEDSLRRAGAHRAELIRALEEVPVAHRRGMAFLVENLPERDVRSIGSALLLSRVAQAYAARQLAPWGEKLPEEVFLDAVLPYANLNEKRERWWDTLEELSRKITKGCKTPGAAAMKLNAELFPKLSVRYSTKRQRPDQAPSLTMSSGLASCTGLSILLSAACRSVGVPCRLAGIAAWPEKRGNHTWVEVWSEGSWHILGAAEPGPLNQTWFLRDASTARTGSRQHGVFAATWKRSQCWYPLVWLPQDRDVPAVEVTARYAGRAQAPAGTGRLLIEVRSPTGERVAAHVHLVSADGRRVVAGMTRDEGADTNDLLAFDLPTQTPWVIRTQTDGTPLRVSLKAGEARTLRIIQR